jgi:uncharacterized membrane protein YfcA
MDGLQYVTAGALVGLVVGLTGVGGGALMTPLLVLMFGVAPTTAVGTDLLFAAITKILGSAIHHQRQGVDWLVVRRLWWGSLPAAAATLVGLQSLGGQRPADETTSLALGVVLVISALSMLLRPRLQGWSGHLGVRPGAGASPWQSLLTVVAGAVIGALVTLTSVGAGALGAVALLWLYPTRMTPARLVGTDLAHAVLLAILAGAGHLFIGHIDLALLGWLLLGSLPGVAIGSMSASRVNEPVLRSVIAVVLGAVGLRMLLT